MAIQFLCTTFDSWWPKFTQWIAFSWCEILRFFIFYNLFFIIFRETAKCLKHVSITWIQPKNKPSAMFWVVQWPLLVTRLVELAVGVAYPPTWASHTHPHRFPYIFLSLLLKRKIIITSSHFFKKKKNKWNEKNFKKCELLTIRLVYLWL